VRTHRQLHRERRKNGGAPVVSLVGYTNAGKSTLLNALAGAGVLAEDSQSSMRPPNGCAPDACFRRPLPQAREAGSPGKQPAPGPSLGSLAARGRDEHVAVLRADGEPHDALAQAA
jgi:energy-coupling factor transporter ATP-binding protein EcfA2